jgi:hypothetical protein
MNFDIHVLFEFKKTTLKRHLPDSECKQTAYRIQFKIVCNSNLSLLKSRMCSNLHNINFQASTNSGHITFLLAFNFFNQKLINFHEPLNKQKKIEHLKIYSKHNSSLCSHSKHHFSIRSQAVQTKFIDHHPEIQTKIVNQLKIIKNIK